MDDVEPATEYPDEVYNTVASCEVPGPDYYFKLNIFQACAGDLNLAKEVYAWTQEK